MEWNRQNILEFINFYRNHEVLWNPKHWGHYSKLQKQLAWEEIAKLTNRSTNDCKKKMEYLLSSLRREKMKMTRTCGSYKLYESSWFAFNSMRFLWEKDKAKATIKPVPGQSTEEPTTNEPEDDSLEQKDTSTLLEHSPSSAQMQPRRRKRLRAMQLDDSYKLLKLLKSGSEVESRDECYFFGNFVASKLREYDTKTRFTIQNDIMAAFARANDAYQDTIDSYPNNISVPSVSYSQSPTYSGSAHLLEDQSDSFLPEITHTFKVDDSD